MKKHCYFSLRFHIKDLFSNQFALIMNDYLCLKQEHSVFGLRFDVKVAILFPVGVVNV